MCAVEVSRSYEEVVEGSSNLFERKITGQRVVGRRGEGEASEPVSAFMAKRLTQARFVEESVAAATVVVFSKSFCPESRRAKASLVALDVDFKSIDLDGFCFVCRHEPAKIASTLASMTGQRALPSCWVGGKFLGACDDVLAGIEDGVFRALEGRGRRRGPSREEKGGEDDVEEKKRRQAGGGGVTVHKLHARVT